MKFIKQNFDNVYDTIYDTIIIFRDFNLFWNHQTLPLIPLAINCNQYSD